MCRTDYVDTLDDTLANYYFVVVKFDCYYPSIRLMVLKARWPDRITLLRGNHESRQITQVLCVTILI